LSLDIRNTCKFECPLIENDFIHWLKTIAGTFLAITFSNIGTSMLCVGPVSSSQSPLERLLLAQQILLGGVCHGHIASVDTEPWGFSLRAEVIVRGARVPDEEVTRLRTDFLPLAAVVLEPLHSSFGVSVPFGCPGGNAFFVGHITVEFLGEEMSTRADNEATVIWAVGEEVDQALQATEAGLGRVLVLVWPWFVGREVSTAVLY
jgi:hypothetical protein